MSTKSIGLPVSLDGDSSNPAQSQPPTCKGLPQDYSEMASAPARRARPTRNAANKASVKISATARRETSSDAADGPTGALLDEALVPTKDQTGDQAQWKAWVEIESEPVSVS